MLKARIKYAVFFFRVNQIYSFLSGLLCVVGCLNVLRATPYRQKLIMELSCEFCRQFLALWSYVCSLKFGLRI